MYVLQVYRVAEQRWLYITHVQDMETIDKLVAHYTTFPKLYNQIQYTRMQ